MNREFRTLIQSVADHPVPDPSLPTDVAIWNGFEIERVLSFRFVTQTRDIEGFTATLSSFRIVPQPSSVFLDFTSAILFCYPRQKHSQKPDAVRKLIEEFSPGPYLEMYGRSNRKGWTVYGSQAG